MFEKLNCELEGNETVSLLIECIEDFISDAIFIYAKLKNDLPKKLQEGKKFKELLGIAEGDFVVLDEAFFPTRYMMDRTARVIIPDLEDNQAMIFHFTNGPMWIDKKHIIAKVFESDSKKQQSIKFIDELAKQIMAASSDDATIN